MAKQMVKISQGRVRDKGILLKSLELVDKNKNKLLDCAVYNNSELVVCSF